MARMARHAALWVGLLAGCSADDASTTTATLTLVREQKIASLLPSTGGRFEASGVALRGGYLHVVFDNRTAVGVFSTALTSGRLTSDEKGSSQYEGITSASGDHPGFYVIQEKADGNAAVLRLDEGGAVAQTEATNVIVPVASKGLEGLAWLQLDGVETLLALCEGNFCTGDTETVGNGQIKVLQRQEGRWVAQRTLALPAAAAFRDHADLALRDRGDGTMQIAVVSQQSSALWLGTLTTSPLAIVGDGAVYPFPTDDEGDPLYCAVEGVTFLDERTLAVVSDADDSERCAARSESIHVFTVP